MSEEKSIADVIEQRSRFAVLCARVEEVEALLPEGCASLMPVDGPYHGQKGDAWDNEHKSDASFLRWKGERYAAWRRILAPNGTIYDFASPAMGARTEVAMREHFEVLCNIRWQKPKGATKAELSCKEALRAPYPASETIIMAEQRGSDSIALGESQYRAKCDELRGFVFEPIRAYFDAERVRSGLSTAQIQDGMHARTGVRYTFDRHTFSTSQWEMPTRAQFDAARTLFEEEGSPVGRPYLNESYESLRLQYESLRLQYESLRLQYESLRRPYYLSADVPYTDVWTYDTVQTYNGKHLCEKPRAMAANMVRASSRPDDLVLVFFAGSGVFAAEALSQGRRVIAVEADPYWAERTKRACEAAIEHGIADMKRIARTTPKNQPAPTGQRAFSW